MILVVTLVKPRFRLFVFIEIFSVDVRLKLRNEGRFHVFDLVPIDIFEPGVGFNFFCSIFAQPGRLVAEKPADDIDHFKRNRYLRREVKVLFVVLNFEIYLFVIFTRKRSVTDKHLVDDDPHCPPIHQLSVSRSLQHLRRDVVRRAHSTERQFSITMCVWTVFLKIFLEGL